MPYRSERTLYTDTNPVDPDFCGEVVEAGDPRAAFVLVRQGGVVSDEMAQRFGLIGRAGIAVYDSENAQSGPSSTELTAESAAPAPVVPPRVSRGRVPKSRAAKATNVTVRL